jgi:opacity protein-like surface antigen
MKLVLALAGTLVLASGPAAWAQTPGGQPPTPAAGAPTQPPAATPPPEYRWSLEGFAQSSFGPTTSQAYGGEGGFKITPNLQIFVEIGTVRNVATSALGTHAQAIASYLTATQSSPVTFTGREPVVFGTGGLKYIFYTNAEKLEPYVLLGFGVARVTKDVHFYVGGADVTSSLDQYRVILGSDLSGEETDPMLEVGGGLYWLFYKQLFLDIQYRYNHIFSSIEGLSLNRVGAGIGIRF